MHTCSMYDLHTAVAANNSNKTCRVRTLSRYRKGSLPFRRKRRRHRKCWARILSQNSTWSEVLLWWWCELHGRKRKTFKNNSCQAHDASCMRVVRKLSVGRRSCKKWATLSETCSHVQCTRGEDSDFQRRCVTHRTAEQKITLWLFTCTSEYISMYECVHANVSGKRQHLEI